MGNSVTLSISQWSKLRLAPALVVSLALTACGEFDGFNLGEAFSSDEADQSVVTDEETGEEFIEQDVEAPEVFSKNEAALWDGRPSLGGVWVAHPDVGDPERVMIRNLDNGQFVVGALFRRERDMPGPNLQLSSDAAQALNVVAGSPVELSVVALRKERIPVELPEPEAPVEVASAPEAPVEIEETPLDPIAAAGAAIDAAEPTPVETVEAPEATVESTLPATRLEVPYIQVGIYNVERNAQAVADQMRSAGMVPTVRETTNDGTSSWRVIVGPATDRDERSELMAKIKAEGYSDAYPVRN